MANIAQLNTRRKESENKTKKSLLYSEDENASNRTSAARCIKYTEMQTKKVSENNFLKTRRKKEMYKRIRAGQPRMVAFAPRSWPPALEIFGSR